MDKVKAKEKFMDSVRNIKKIAKEIQEDNISFYNLDFTRKEEAELEELGWSVSTMVCNFGDY